MTTLPNDQCSKRLWREPSVWLASVGGLGFSPRAPGTVGSLPALLILWFSGATGLETQWLMCGLLFLVGWWASHRTGLLWQISDHPAIVIDEVVGQWLTLLIALSLVPQVMPLEITLALGFVLFRLYDVLKPWPVSWADRQLKGGWGVMIDDVVAGLLAGAVLTIATLAWDPF